MLIGEIGRYERHKDATTTLAEIPRESRATICDIGWSTKRRYCQTLRGLASVAFSGLSTCAQISLPRPASSPSLPFRTCCSCLLLRLCTAVSCTREHLYNMAHQFKNHGTEIHATANPSQSPSDSKEDVGGSSQDRIDMMRLGKKQELNVSQGEVL